jgi:hypothetical protein
MRHRVARIFTHIHDEAVSGIGDLINSGDGLRATKHIFECRTITLDNLVGVRDVTFRDHQDVGGRGWVEIPEGEAKGGFMNLRSWDDPGCDATKKAIRVPPVFRVIGVLHGLHGSSITSDSSAVTMSSCEP